MFLKVEEVVRVKVKGIGSGTLNKNIRNKNFSTCVKGISIQRKNMIFYSDNTSYPADLEIF